MAASDRGHFFCAVALAPDRDRALRIHAGSGRTHGSRCAVHSSVAHAMEFRTVAAGIASGPWNEIVRSCHSGAFARLDCPFACWTRGWGRARRGAASAVVFPRPPFRGLEVGRFGDCGVIRWLGLSMPGVFGREFRAVRKQTRNHAEIRSVDRRAVVGRVFFVRLPKHVKSIAINALDWCRNNRMGGLGGISGIFRADA